MKRGESGLCAVFGIDKPCGITSHDVVNKVRSIFGERRVGHCGTLDPLASGALLVCVGPATRLDAYLESDTKEYWARIAFGSSTDTDDADGEPLETVEPAEIFFDHAYARARVQELVGESMQVPPVYSALKVDGKKACDEARSGRHIDVQARPIKVTHAQLQGISKQSDPRLIFWDVRVTVSKGTYIRAIARDLGKRLGCPAHLAGLRRLRAGGLSVDECVSLEALEELGLRAAIDPLGLLGYRFAFLEGELAKRVDNGAKLPFGVVDLYAMNLSSPAQEMDACSSPLRESLSLPSQGERIALLSDNRLKAIYFYDDTVRSFVPDCVFQTGVDRGRCI